MEANPKDQLITKTDLAKSENSWGQLPHIVSKGAQTNFLYFAHDITKQWESDKDAFNESYFKSAVARMILFRNAESIISSQGWYSGGYRANIVTYTIARIAHEIATLGKMQLNFAYIWEAQDLSDALRAQIASTAETVYKNITRPRAGFENVTQWCKREECWINVRNDSAPLIAILASELVSLDDVRADRRHAKALQKVDSGIEAQVAVMALGPEFWRALATWASAHNAVSPDDRRLIALAYDNDRVPSDRQAARLLQLRDRLEQEGFLYLSEPA